MSTRGMPHSSSAHAFTRRCLEDFVTRLEATVKKRMRVKVGTMQTVDWVSASYPLNSPGVPTPWAGATAPRPQPLEQLAPQLQGHAT